MKTAVVICEFNPLHLGHAKLIAEAKSRSDYVLCVMSGSVVQRGEVALVDKYARAAQAIAAGADAVIELPAQFVLSGAKQFAYGAVSIANLVNGEVEVIFGSECGDIHALEVAAKLVDDPSVQASLKELLSRGLSYPDALAKAATTVTKGDDFALAADVLSTPNNVLGIEYIKAIINTGAKISYHTIKRPPCDDSANPTSSEIRRKAISRLDVTPCVPNYTARDLAAVAHTFESRESKLFALIKYILPSTQKGIYDDAEGLSNRLSAAAKKARDYQEYLALAKVKRYPMARIKRLTINTLIDNRSTHQSLLSSTPKAVRLLAADKSSTAAVLGSISAKICSSSSDCDAYADEFELSRRADALFESVAYPLPRHDAWIITR